MASLLCSTVTTSQKTMNTAARHRLQLNTMTRARSKGVSCCYHGQPPFLSSFSGLLPGNVVGRLSLTLTLTPVAGRPVSILNHVCESDTSLQPTNHDTHAISATPSPSVSHMAGLSYIVSPLRGFSTLSLVCLCSRRSLKRERRPPGQLSRCREGCNISC